MSPAQTELDYDYFRQKYGGMIEIHRACRDGRMTQEEKAVFYVAIANVQYLIYLAIDDVAQQLKKINAK